MKNRDAKKFNKRSERQVELAGKLPYHRVNKLVKIHRKSLNSKKVGG